MDSPNVVFYYKGTEQHEDVPKALNSVVAFDIEDGLALEEDEAMRLCNELNNDKTSLIEHGFTEFDIIKITNSF